MKLSLNLKALGYYVSRWFSFIKDNMLALSLLMVIVGSSFYTLFLVSYYLNIFNVTPQTLLDNEKTKVFSSRFSQYQLIDRINRTLPKDAYIMVFRVADFAFYGKRNYISYVDKKISDHVQHKTAQDVWHYLRGQGITHLYLPPYSLPSIYNSGLENLLSSPQYSELLYDFEGYRLFHLLKKENPVEMTLITGEDFAAKNEDIKNWIFKKKLNPLILTGNSLNVTGDKHYLSSPLNKTVLYRGRMKKYISPFMNKIHYDFEDNGTYQFKASVSGHSFLKIYLERYMYQGHSSKQVHIPLWEGVLNGNKRTIQSLFGILPHSDFSSTILKKNEAYRLVFELGPGAKVNIENWFIHQVQQKTLRPFQKERMRKVRLVQKGWQHASFNKYMSYGLKVENDKDIIFLEGQSSHPLRMKSPAFYNPLILRNHSFLANIEEVKNTSDYPLDRSIKQAVYIHFRAKGEGLLNLQAEISCFYQKKREKNNKKIVPLNPFVLSKELNDIKNVFYSPCPFKYIRLATIITPDNLSIGTFGKSPPILYMQDLSIKIHYINQEKKISIQPLKQVKFPINYIK